MPRRVLSWWRLQLPFLLAATTLQGIAATIPPNVDRIVTWGLGSSGAPSASVAIVTDGRLTYTKAFGEAALQPARTAAPDMRYAIGSISKQFTAAAVLFLVEQHKLSLDDTVSKYIPDLTRAGEVTIRMLLSHTSGYSDYWPEDYVMTTMMKPVTPREVMEKWGKRPLDFDPGTKWQYSNTNYTIAGQIVEKVSGEPLLQLLKERIFNPLQMTSVYDVDSAPLPASDASGYYRHALGPLRPAPKEGRGWLSAAGELAMTASDLARWDISLINRTLLKPDSYSAMFKEVKLKDGSGTGYGLGVQVRKLNGLVRVEHNGEISGFTADNIVVPDAKVAVVVLVNQDAVGASGAIANAILTPVAGQAQGSERILRIFRQFQANSIDRSQFTELCNEYFTAEAVEDYSRSLQPLGEPLFIAERGHISRGGMTFRAYRIQFESRLLSLTTFEMPDGKLEQFLIGPVQP